MNSHNKKDNLLYSFLSKTSKPSKNKGNLAIFESNNGEPTVVIEQLEEKNSLKLYVFKINYSRLNYLPLFMGSMLMNLKKEIFSNDDALKNINNIKSTHQSYILWLNVDVDILNKIIHALDRLQEIPTDMFFSVNSIIREIAGIDIYSKDIDYMLPFTPHKDSSVEHHTLKPSLCNIM